MKKTEVTLKDIARETGVSVATVDRALHNRGEINEKTKQRIMQKAKELGYQPNMLARSLVMKKSFRVAATIPDSPLFFWDEMEAGLRFSAENFAPLGIRMTVMRYDSFNFVEIVKNIKTFLHEQYDAIILRPHDVPLILDALNECVAKGVKIVMLNDTVPATDYLFYVGPNDVETGLAAGQIMGLFVDGLPRGKLGIARNSSTNSYSLRQRYNYFCKQIKQQCPQIEVVDVSEEIEKRMGKTSIYEITKYYLDHYPDLVAIYNDSGTVMEVAECVRKHAKKKVFVVGHEISPEISECLKDGTIDAVVSQDPFSQGYYAMKHLGDYLLTGKEPESPVYLTHTDIILKSNTSYTRRAL